MSLSLADKARQAPAAGDDHDYVFISNKAKNEWKWQRVEISRKLLAIQSLLHVLLSTRNRSQIVTKYIAEPFRESFLVSELLPFLVVVIIIILTTQLTSFRTCCCCPRTNG